MKTSFSLRTAFVGVTGAFVLGLAGINSASAESVNIGIRIGNSAPPRIIEERRWERPHREAVWIPGHYEWRRGRYVWVGGYYTYPPRRGAVWVQDRYTRRDGVYYYQRGHWRD